MSFVNPFMNYVANPLRIWISGFPPNLLGSRIKEYVQGVVLKEICPTEVARTVTGQSGAALTAAFRIE